MKYCWLAMGHNQARRRMIEEGKTFYKKEDGNTPCLTTSSFDVLVPWATCEERGGSIVEDNELV